MTLEKAKRIEHLRIGPIMHSWRRISEIICDEYPDEDQECRGSQLYGIYVLCRPAMMLLNGVDKISDVPDNVRDKWGT